MYVWVFTGNLGEGKTFGMSVLAHYFANKARKSGLPVDLYANFGLKGAKPLYSYRNFFNVARSPNSICLMDEAHVNLDSRLFSKGSNIYMTQFFFYLRKLHTSLFMTTPHIRNLDSRMRQLTNILVVCHRMGGSFSYDIYDYQAERLLRRKFLPKYIAQEIFAVGMYDTDAIIRNVEFPSNERTFDQFLTKIVKVRDGKDMAFTDGHPALQPARDPAETFERGAAGTRFGHETGNVPGAVPDKRHALPGERGEDNLPLLSVVAGQARNGIHDLHVKIRFADVMTVQGRAFDGEAQPRLCHAVMGKNGATPHPPELVDDGPRDIVRRQEHALDTVGRDAPPTVPLHPEHLRGYPDEAVDAEPHDIRQRLFDIAHRAVNDPLNIHPGKPPFQKVAHAVPLFPREEYEHPLPGGYEGGHAVMEKVDGEFQVLRGEKEPLRRACRARGGKGNDTRYLVLRDTEET